VRVIGPADDFWRVRISRVDTADAPDLDWRDDILYRRPPRSADVDVREWNVEAVRLEDDEVALIGSFVREEDAREFMGEAEVDLAVLTRAAFERKYLEEDISVQPDGTKNDGGSEEV
jgi:hypothetical protein